MQVEFLSTRPFTGWPDFRSLLGQVDAQRAIGMVQLFTKHVADQQDGVFRGVGPIYPINLHVVLREWVTSLDSGSLPIQDPLVRDAVGQVLLEACRRINTLRESHAALNRSRLWLPASLRVEEHVRVFWFHHLEQQGLSWAPKAELGRSARMFAEIWPQLQQDGRIKVQGTASTAFLSPDYALLLALGTWWANGIVQDVRQLFANMDLSHDVIGTLLDSLCAPLDEVKSVLADTSLYPENIQNIFQRYPLIRSGDWSVFAPLPDLLLQGWDLRALFDGLDCALANLGSDGGKEYYRALGVVFEEYVNELLAELADLAGADYIPPFKYEGGKESPDGFIRSGEGPWHTFEAKCYRVPQRAYEEMELAEFERWFNNLLGTNDGKRPPLKQGSTFFEAWSKGDSEITSRLGTDGDNGAHLIISHEDVPACSNWLAFRRWFTEKHIQSSESDIWTRTIIASVRDLEKLIAAAHATQANGTTFDLNATLAGYLEYRDGTPDVSESQGFKDTIGNWILTRVPAARDHEPARTREARDRLFAQALQLGFGEEAMALP